MLSEFEAIEQTAGADKAADLRKALHYLLRRQFVFAGDSKTGAVYNTIMDGRFRSVIDGFFDSCGYRMHRDFRGAVGRHRRQRRGRAAATDEAR